MRAEDVSQVGVRLSIKQDTDIGIGEDDKAGIGKDNKAGIRRQDDKAGIGQQDNNRVDDLGQDNKAGIERRDNKMGPDEKGVAEPATRACHTRTQRLLCRAFLLAAYSNRFLTFSFLESVIG